jgi:8-oxo-dGTP pyrophosphatase MutT (NUDIX family)
MDATLLTPFQDRGRPCATVRVCVGALILNPLGQVFVQRRAPTAAVWPGVWDIVGGHMEPDESTADALAREVREETGWAVVRIGPLVAKWEWEHSAIVRREYDYFVDVLGDLSAPTLNPNEHDAWMWIGADSLDRLLEGTNGDARLRQLVARALATQAR